MSFPIEQIIPITTRISPAGLSTANFASAMLFAKNSELPVGFTEDTVRTYYSTEGTPLYRHAQPAPAVQCPFPCGWDNLNKLAIRDAALVARGLVEGEPTTEAQRQAAISNNDRLLKVISACRAAMLNQK